MDALMALTRPVEDAVLFGAAGFLLKASRDSEANDRVAAIRAAADAVGSCAVAIHLHPTSSTNSAGGACLVLVPAPFPRVAAHIVDAEFVRLFLSQGVGAAMKELCMGGNVPSVGFLYKGSFRPACCASVR